MVVYKLEFEDEMIEKVKAFFKQLPSGVKVTQDNSISQSNDFIEYLTNNPIETKFNDNFLSRSDANAR